MFRAPVGYVVPLIGRSLGGTLTGGDVVTAAAPHRWVLRLWVVDNFDVSPEPRITRK